MNRWVTRDSFGDGLALGQRDRQRDHELAVGLREVRHRADPLRLVADRVADARVRAVRDDPDLFLAAGHVRRGERRAGCGVRVRADDQDRLGIRQGRQDVGHLATRVLVLVRAALEGVDREVLLGRDRAADALEAFLAPARASRIDLRDRREVERDVGVVRALELGLREVAEALAGDQAGLTVVGADERLLARFLGRVDGDGRQVAVGLADLGGRVGIELPVDHGLQLLGLERSRAGERLLGREVAVALGQLHAGRRGRLADAVGHEQHERIAVAARDVADAEPLPGHRRGRHGRGCFGCGRGRGCHRGRGGRGAGRTGARHGDEGHHREQGRPGGHPAARVDPETGLRHGSSSIARRAARDSHVSWRPAAT